MRKKIKMIRIKTRINDVEEKTIIEKEKTWK